MQRIGTYFIAALVLCCLLTGLTPGVLAKRSVQLTVTPEIIYLILPQDTGQEYKIHSTQNPMKVIIDCDQVMEGFLSQEKFTDPALKEIRYSQNQDGSSRLVLEFNYLLPEQNVLDLGASLQVEIPKTFVQTSRRTVELGVIYGHQRRADTFGPNVINYLEIDLNRRIEVKLALAQDQVFGSEHVSSLSERHGAIAAVNGAYFAANGRPLGVFMIDGHLISEPYANRTALGLTKKGAVMEQVSFSGEVNSLITDFSAPITGLNRPRLQDELIVYTPYYGTKTNTNVYGYEVTVVDGIVTDMQLGNSSIPTNGLVLSGHGVHKQNLSQLQIGDRLDVRLGLEPDWTELGVEQIIGGGPRLVQDGELWITGEAERFQPDILQGRAPRTALGITADNKLLLVTVNGRQPNISVGMSLTELGHLLIELGAIQAMNLDGGGSTTMVVRNLVLNLPSNGQERPVSNGIVVITNP